MIELNTLHDQILTGELVPLSFRIGDSGARLCRQATRRYAAAAGQEVHTVAYECDELPVRVSVRTEYLPAKNCLSLSAAMDVRETISDRIRDVCILDLSLPAGAAGPVIRSFRGGAQWRSRKEFPRDEFAPWDTDLSAESLEIEDTEGRCSHTYFPVWFLYDADGGLWFGPEWEGTWRCRAARDGQTVRYRLSLPFLEFSPVQGEDIVLPTVTLGGYTGDIHDGYGHLRRTLRDVFLPDLAGRAPLPQVSYQALEGQIPLLAGEGMRREADLAAGVGCEEFILASIYSRGPDVPPRYDRPEWYAMSSSLTGETENNVWFEFNGAITPHPDRFPGGVGAFVSHLRDNGMRLGLWYDPRVHPQVNAYPDARDTLVPFHREQEQDKCWDMGLIDLGSRAGRDYMLGWIDYFVQECGAELIWHDLNVEVRDRYWKHVEEPGRAGLMELRYFHGLYEVYDEVRRRYPHVRIEWCASGGTMISLGILRRVHSLWVTDYTDMKFQQGEDCNCDRARAIRTRLLHLLPASLIFNSLYVPKQIYDTDRPIGWDNLLTQLGGNFGLGHYLQRLKPSDLDDVRRAVEVFKEIRHLLNRDFHEPLPTPTDQTQWQAWQFHDPDSGEGVVVLFKLHECTTDQQRLDLKWVNPTALQCTVPLGEASLAADADGLSVDMPDRAAVIRYRAR